MWLFYTGFLYFLQYLDSIVYLQNNTIRRVSGLEGDLGLGFLSSAKRFIFLVLIFIYLFILFIHYFERVSQLAHKLFYLAAL